MRSRFGTRVGFSRDYDAVQIRRALQPAVEELEALGFVVAEPVERRYRKIARGKWEVSFERGTGKMSTLPAAPKPAAGRKPSPSVSTKRTRAVEAGETAEARRVQKFLAGLTAEDRTNLEQEAAENADPFLPALVTSGGAAGATSSQLILHKHVLSLLASGAASESE